MASVLGLDYGSKRVGVAIAHDGVSIASPLTTLENSEDLIEKLAKLAQAESATRFVVGLPRNLDGDDTAQTKQVRQFAKKLETVGFEVVLQDEAGTTLAAGADQPDFVDARAASLILADYLTETKSSTA